MQQIFPTTIENIDLNDAYSIEATSHASHFRINMVSSLDGEISINGISKALSSETDRKAFHVMRAMADVLLVGAGTARKENYGPPKLSDEDQTLRVSRGQQPIPPIAVVTRTANFDWNTPIFTEALARPIILTTKIGAQNASSHTDIADIIDCGDDVDFDFALDQLHARGLNSILCEGGPSLNADLLKARVVDELCLTISPMIVQGSGKSIFDGPELDTPAGMEVTHIFIDEGNVFLRLRVKNS